MPIRTLIVDDEAPARALLKHYLSSHSDIEVIGEAADGFEAFRLVKELQPELMLLDIRMPKLSGFELLELLENPPAVIFTTAFDEYAIKAFEANACDYLMKPFLRDRLDVALDKARLRLTSNAPAEESPVNKLLENGPLQEEKLQRVAVRSGQKIRIIPVNDVLYFESDGDYVLIHTAEGRFLKEKTMKFFESHLDERQFVRVHRSYIVNVEHIKGMELYEKDSWTLLLSNREYIKVSATGYKALKKVLNL
ncbi:LytR/AlgR family response regulator transcription factor [Parabacteroides sp. FAFU027]|uniref:LytR/AlgR family response regulator transcription factor n=1 Tax=Parabacteroides sp. FAFU027 TaxID=2922715 RepID=UPI001FAE8759|nr:LytTR family transcriptional regulator DNA-binding domain-containing protein [Parabacteroides sp. FAFU027]